MDPQELASFEANRARMFGLAYRMLGEAAEAEDVVQDAYLRWREGQDIAVPAAWLTKVVTNLCLSRLASARARRERYVGPWLPEPVLTGLGLNGLGLTGPGREQDPVEVAERRDSLSLGVLVLLERLTPPERAAFVLRSAFDYSHREIAEILDIDEVHARQLYSRARAHVGEPRRRFTATPEQREKIVEQFLAAAVGGDLTGLERLLTEDATAWSDGGGEVAATRHPAFGRFKIARMLTALAATDRAVTATYAIATVNDTPAVLVREAGMLTVVIVPELTEDGIVAVRAILNPAKLAFITTQLATARSV
ncbi:RNA polymerase sigma factor SigJ [Saccharopolyspora sp. 5N708]|uniref:RNA polymerase sigma factor SigJ n=1 Tax=Saccharopolyspora sp. 5N708 TaxID=3457424 RepID=UPI003FD15A4B